MFHRVKSENQNDQQNQDTAPETDTQEKPVSSRDSSERRPAPASGYAPAQYDAPREKSETQVTAPSTLDIPAPSYQRPAHQMAPARPAAPSYPKAYSAPSYSTPTASDSNADNDRRLTIGRGITMSGEIESCDYLLVEGTVEAALKGASALNIAETGTFYGTVEIEEAVIAGRFEGEITVHGRLTIKSSGVITGTIAYKELEVESGAVIDGRLTPVSSAGGARAESGRGKGQSSPKSKPASKPKASEPANSDGELFATDAAE
jgi:cytoskeletal protein CcmA (bactofilin family)